MIRYVETDNLEEETDPSDPAQDPSKKRNNGAKHRPESTLAKSAAQLRTKKLDLEFIVDPLFKKTCADFDESGAQGLLMNHLNLGLGAGCLRVVFDASDCVAASGEAEDEGDVEEHEPEEPEDLIDLSHLRREYCSRALCAVAQCKICLGEFLPSLDALDTKAISHSLESFSFERGAFDFTDVAVLDTTDLALDNDEDGIDADIANNMTIDFGDDGDRLILPEGGIETMNDDSPEVEDFFVGDQAVGDDHNGDTYDEAGVSAPAVFTNSGGNAGAGVGPYEPFDPRRMPNERDLIMAMTVGEPEENGGGGGMMDYFDKNFLKNWAGPEHWKVKRAVRRRESLYRLNQFRTPTDGLFLQHWTPWIQMVVKKVKPLGQKPDGRRKRRKPTGSISRNLLKSMQSNYSRH